MSRGSKLNIPLFCLVRKKDPSYFGTTLSHAYLTAQLDQFLLYSVHPRLIIPVERDRPHEAGTGSRSGADSVHNASGHGLAPRQDNVLPGGGGGWGGLLSTGRNMVDQVQRLPTQTNLHNHTNTHQQQGEKLLGWTTRPF